MMGVNEGTHTHIDGKEAAGAERRLERQRDEEEADKTREAGQDGQLHELKAGQQRPWVRVRLRHEKNKRN